MAFYQRVGSVVEAANAAGAASVGKAAAPAKMARREGVVLLRVAIAELLVDGG